jgi:hypothetical protein
MTNPTPGVSYWWWIAVTTGPLVFWATPEVAIPIFHCLSATTPSLPIRYWTGTGWGEVE